MMMTALNNPLMVPFITNPFTIDDSYTIRVDRVITRETEKFEFNTEEADRFINEGRVSNNVYAEALRISGGDKLATFELVSKGIETNQWIRFAIYYMTDPLANVSEYADKECKEFVNSISVLAGFGKIYESEDIADIDEYDCTQINAPYSGRFFLHKPELIDFLSSNQFIYAKTKKMMAMAANSEEFVSERPALTTTAQEKKDEKVYANPAFAILEGNDYNGDIIYPTFTTVDNSIQQQPVVETVNPGFSPVEFGFIPKQLPKKGNGVDTHAYVKFEAILGKFIPETIYYHYEYINGFYYLYITRPESGAEEFYILDDGSIMGGSSVSILANYITPDGLERSMFVDICAHPAIASKILTRTLFNYLTPEEVEACRGDFLYDTRIYNNIDFHNTGFFDDFTYEQKYNFEVSLLGVMTVMNNIGYGNVRFRFDSFSDFNHFSLVSDYYMYRPLPYIQNNIMPDTFVLEGAMITVDGSSIVVNYNGEIKKFKMG